MQLHFPKGLLAACLIGFGLAAAAQSVEVTTATQLRAAPALDAKALLRLERGARVERTGTQGGWIKVRSAEREGWVRLTHVRSLEAALAASSPTTAPNPVTGVGGMFSATSNKPTATTGTRGMPQEQQAGGAKAAGETQLKPNPK